MLSMSRATCHRMCGEDSLKSYLDMCQLLIEEVWTSMHFKKVPHVT